MQPEAVPKIAVSYADPIAQARYEHVLRSNRVQFKYSTLEGQKAVLIGGLSARELAEKTREFEDWLSKYLMQQRVSDTDATLDG